MAAWEVIVYAESLFPRIMGIFCHGLMRLPADLKEAQQDATFEARRITRGLDGWRPGSPEPEPTSTALDKAFWFEHDHFALNRNWTVVDSGLAFRFDAYEVSSYSFGRRGFVFTSADPATQARPEGPMALR